MGVLGTKTSIVGLNRAHRRGIASSRPVAGGGNGGGPSNPLTVYVESNEVKIDMHATSDTDIEAFVDGVKLRIGSLNSLDLTAGAGFSQISSKVVESDNDTDTFDKVIVTGGSGDDRFVVDVRNGNPFSGGPVPVEFTGNTGTDTFDYVNNGTTIPTGNGNPWTEAGDSNSPDSTLGFTATFTLLPT